jgi:hypothetical protein
MMMIQTDVCIVTQELHVWYECTYSECLVKYVLYQTCLDRSINDHNWRVKNLLLLLLACFACKDSQTAWYCSDLHLLLLLVTSLIEPPPGKSEASPPYLSLETDRRACLEDDDDDDDAITSLKQLMETMLYATMSCSSSSSDGRGRGGWE